MTETFATLLRRALDERDITASDLARRIWGNEGSAGNGARNRQLISHYLNGKMRPKLSSIEQIATALQMPVSAFLPSLGGHKMSVEASLEDDQVRLKIDRSVDAATAMKIIEILSA